MSQKILVSGATGTIGKALIQALKASPVPLVAGVRDPRKAADVLGADVATVAFDFSDTSSYAAATEGVDCVFVLGPPLNPAAGELIAPFLDFLKQQNILRVVYLSANGADKMGDALPFHVEMESKLKREGFRYTILQPSFFAQNFKNYEGENITERGIVYAPAGNGKAAFVDVHDIAAVAATVLTEEGHEGKTYVLTGSEALSYQDAADVLSEVLGKSIQYPAPTPEEYSKTLAAAGAPPFVANYMIDVYGLIRKGGAAGISQDIEQVTGRKATPFRQAIEQDFAVLA